MKKRREFMQESENIREDTVINDDYNSEPVFYCKKCLSLKILALDSSTDYCDVCGSTDIETTHIETWREMYKNKYGKEF